MTTPTRFAGGKNIAMKVPPRIFEATVHFYREVLGLQEIAGHAPSVVFVFGSSQLWIDRDPNRSQAEIWLEIITDNLATAAEQFNIAGVSRCDEIEPLPPGFQAFWISNPASIIHLVCPQDACEQ